MSRLLRAATLALALLGTGLAIVTTSAPAHAECGNCG